MKKVKDLLRFIDSLNTSLFNNQNIEMLSYQTYLKIQKIIEYIKKMSKNQYDVKMDPILWTLKQCLSYYPLINKQKKKAAISKHDLIKNVIDRINFYAIFDLFDKS